MAGPFDNMFTPPAQENEGYKRVKAAKNLAMQQAAGAITPEQSTMPNAAQTLGAGATQLAGQKTLEANKQAGATNAATTNLALQAATQQKQQQLAQQGLAQQVQQTQAKTQQNAAVTREQRDAQQQLTEAEIHASERLTRIGIETDNNLSFLDRTQREQLAKLGGDVKQQLFDARLQFAKDETGRKFNNERQLADYSISSAQSKQELAYKLQTMQDMANRDLKMMEAVHARITQGMKEDSMDRQREMTQKTREEIVRAKMAADAAARRKKAKANNMRSIVVGAATVAGAVIGGSATFGTGTAAGAAVGAQVGGAAGSILSSQAGG